MRFPVGRLEVIEPRWTQSDTQDASEGMDVMGKTNSCVGGLGVELTWYGGWGDEKPTLVSVDACSLGTS